MKMELNLANLKDLDFGKVDVAWKQHLKRAVHDCNDRPGDERPRVVVLTMNLLPVLADNGECDEVKMECQVASKVPPHRSKTFACKPNKSGHLLFDAENPDDFDQGAFSDLKEEDNETNQ